MADANRHSIHYVAETSYGQTPNKPAWKQCRNTGITLALTKNTTQSEELREDRQMTCFEHGNKQVGGDINFEFSPHSQDDFLAAALQSSWQDDNDNKPTGAKTQQILKVGTLRQSFSFLRHFSDLAGSKKHILLTGVEFNNVSLSVAPDAIVTGSFTTIGQDQQLAATAPTGSTYQATDTTCPFNSFSGVIKEGGKVNGVITEISFTSENGMEVRNVIGSDTTIQPSTGKSNITGSITAYFNDVSLLEKFINASASSLEFSLQKGNVTYTFTFPNIKYTGGQADVSGSGALTIPLPFQALLDQTAGSNLIITKTTN